MVRVLVIGMVALLAIYIYQSGDDSVARACEQEVGLSPGTAAFDACYDHLETADTRARSRIFGGLILIGG